MPFTYEVFTSKRIFHCIKPGRASVMSRLGNLFFQWSYQFMKLKIAISEGLIVQKRGVRTRDGWRSPKNVCVEGWLTSGTIFSSPQRPLCVVGRLGRGENESMWGSVWGKQSISILPLIANTKLRTTLLLERKQGKNDFNRLCFWILLTCKVCLNLYFPNLKKNEQVTIHHLMSLFAVVILMTST